MVCLTLIILLRELWWHCHQVLQEKYVKCLEGIFVLDCFFRPRHLVSSYYDCIKEGVLTMKFKVLNLYFPYKDRTLTANKVGKYLLIVFLWKVNTEYSHVPIYCIHLGMYRGATSILTHPMALVEKVLFFFFNFDRFIRLMLVLYLYLLSYLYCTEYSLFEAITTL